MEEERSETMIVHNGYRIPSTCSIEVLPLAKKNPHPRDAKIAFSDEGHKYFVEGKTEGYTSTTTFIKSHFKPFDAMGVALGIVRRKDFTTNRRYEKYKEVRGMDPSEAAQELARRWKREGMEAANAGTLMHRNIELFYNGIEVKHDQSVEFAKHFVAYDREVVKKHGWVPYRMEMLVYSKHYKIVGSVDAIFYDPVKKTFIVRDWKRSKKISKWGFGKWGRPPLRHLSDCNYVHYCLQQNIYKFLLEAHYGMKVESMGIVVFHPAQKTYLEIEVPDMQEEVLSMLNARELNLYPDEEEEEMAAAGSPPPPVQWIQRPEGGFEAFLPGEEEDRKNVGSLIE